ncbi:MAG: glycosyltransferase family 4 protein [Bacteroidota bacterium]|nr:glycosyltransferase family 4 protein [Bacteroidota bacterium]
MKIAFVINSSWNIFNFRLTLIKSLQQLGHQVIAIAPEDDYAPRLISENCKFIPVSIESRGLNPLKDLKLFLKLWYVFHKEKPDVVMSYTIKPNIYGALAARILGIKIICNVTGLGTVFIRQNPIYKVAHWLYKFAFLYPQKVYFQNSDDYNLFINLKLVSPSKAEIMPGSGVDLQKFMPKKMLSNDKPIFLLVSRILQDKGIKEFIEAIKLVFSKGYEAKFQLLGSIEDSNHSGISVNDIHNWQKQGYITYLGFTDNVLPFYESADCVILPSYREGMPKSLLEAMAVAKPIITTNVPGCRELVYEGENGYLCAPKDSISLANSIEKICNLPAIERQKMGQKSRVIVEQGYDQNFVTFKYIQTINQITTFNGI